MSGWAARLDADERPRTTAPERITPTGGTPYGRAALEREAEELRTMAPGGRNDRLNRAAYAAGQLIAGGELDEGEARAALTAAALASGLGARETAATLESGITSGRAAPRTAPPRESRPAQRRNGRGGPPEDPPDDYEHTDADAPDAPPSGSHAPETAKPKAVFEIIGSAALFAPLEEPDYIVDGVIRRASLTEIVAYGSSGKTWIAADMVLALASGEAWLWRFKCKPGSALYIDYENGAFEMRRRFQAIARGRGLESVDGVGLVSMPPIYMSHDGFGHAIRSVADGRDLIVVDTLKAGNPGIDENDSNMRTGLDALRRVGEQTGCAFVVLAHGKKVSGNAVTIDPREAGRGSSAIFDAADAVLHVHYRGKDEPLLVQQTKARFGRALDPFEVEIRDGVDDAVLVVGRDIQATDDSAASDRFSALCDRVLDVIRQTPGASGRVIREHIDGARVQSVIAAIEMLERHGAIRNVGTANRPKWFPVEAREVACSVE